jgi:hypothetical protein
MIVFPTFASFGGDEGSNAFGRRALALGPTTSSLQLLCLPRTHHDSHNGCTRQSDSVGFFAGFPSSSFCRGGPACVGQSCLPLALLA